MSKIYDGNISYDTRMRETWQDLTQLGANLQYIVSNALVCALLAFFGERGDWGTKIELGRENSKSAGISENRPTSTDQEMKSDF